MSDNQRTRPSEAEVRNLLERAADDIMCPNCASAKGYCDNCQSLKAELRATAAALSTPPLPSAPEPVAWMRKPWFVYAEGDTLHGTCDTSRADKWIAKDPMWIHKVFLRTTPPAASDNATEADRAS